MIGLLGLVLLLQPFGGDQALSLLIARRLQGGAVMYRDVWDIRQPLTFVWYATIGSIFGSSAISVRIAEILWQGTLAYLIGRDVTEMSGSRQRGFITAIASVGPIFWIMQADDVAQPDTLVLLPIYLAFRAIAKANHSPIHPLTAVSLGVACTVIGLFKIVYAPLPALFLLVWVVQRWRERRQAIATAAWFALGLILSALLVVVFFVSTGVWDWVTHTWFVQAPAMRALSPPPLERLIRAAGRFVVLTLPVLIGAVVTIVSLRKRPRDLWTLMAVVWTITSAIAILAQQWWSYLFLALTVPIGLLAGGPLSRWLATTARRLAAALLILVALVATHLFYFRAVVDRGLDPAAIERSLVRAAVVRSEAAALLADPESLEGSIFVFGDPLILLDVGRESTTSIHGWSPEFYDDVTWARLTAELKTTPPAYILVSRVSADVLRRRVPDLVAWLETEYRLVTTLTADTAMFSRNPG